jgi:hypothetical protein
MNNSNKKMKVSNYFTEFRFGESTDYRMELLMEVISKYNLNGNFFSMNVDSFGKTTAFFYKQLMALP